MNRSSELGLLVPERLGLLRTPTQHDVLGEAAPGSSTRSIWWRYLVRSARGRQSSFYTAAMCSGRPDFPRADDGLGFAWGLELDRPTLVWERFSPAYEEQAARLWDEFAARGWHPALEWAGSQDGEAIIGRDDDGEIVCFYHLEDPSTAQELAKGRRPAV